VSFVLALQMMEAWNREMETIDITSEGLRKQGGRLEREGATMVLHYNGFKHRLGLYKNDWDKTVKKTDEKLSDAGIERMVIQSVITSMSDNYPKLMNGHTSAKSSSSSIEVETKETPLAKLDDISFEEWQTELQSRYQKLQATIKQSAMPLYNLWMPLEFAFSIKSLLHIADVTEPFAGILLAPASSLKTITIDLFRKYWRAYFTHSFTPRSWVSHNTSLSEEILQEKVDMLPQMKDRLLLTPELAPTFNAKEEELRQNFAIMSAALDGKGLETNSGGFGRRGYTGEYNFMWLGAIVDIRPHVYNIMGNLGPKVHFLRLPWSDRTEKELIQQTMEGRFQSDHDNIERALYDYLKWFEACPLMQDKNGVPKIVWDTSKNEHKAVRYIARLAKLLGRLRGVVETWDTKGSQGSEYAYNYRRIEESDRANRQLVNLARGHALSQGRNHITIDDVPLVTKVVLSTAPMERVAVFDLLLKNGGSLDVNTITDGLRVSEPTARRTMTELFALELVDRQKEGDFFNSNLKIDLVEQFRWCLGRDFQHLRAGFSPTRISSKNTSFGKRGSNLGDNVESDSTKLKEKRPPHPHILFFWKVFKLLERKSEQPKLHGKKIVSESGLKQAFVSSGKFTAGESTQIVNDMLDLGEIKRLGFDVLVKNSPSDMSKNEEK
jgi:hypothetical protein